MRRPGARIILVKGRGIYDELSGAPPVFLVAATRVFLFGSCVIEVPQPLLAGDRTVTVEDEQLSLVGPKHLVNAAELLGHRFSQSDISPATFDRAAKGWVVAVRLCVVALESNAHGV